MPKVQAPTSNFQLASLTICANASRSIISIYNNLILIKQIERCLTDCMMSWCPFWATLILVIDYCEGRKNKAANTQNLDYIKTGILVLRAGEEKNVLYGRGIDILLPIVKAILPSGDSFIGNQEMISYSKEFESPYSTSSGSANLLASLPDEKGEDLVQPSDEFYRQMLQFMQSEDTNVGRFSNNVSDDTYNTIIDSIFSGNYTGAL